MLCFLNIHKIWINDTATRLTAEVAQFYIQDSSNTHSWDSPGYQCQFWYAQFDPD